MPDKTQPGIECTEFEALLSEAIEGQLSGARKERFEAHRGTCAVCGPLFADAQTGRQWLRSLEEVEPPVHLVHNILASTSGIASRRAPAISPQARTTRFPERVREWWDSYFTPVATFVRQPRFVMSFGMIFFSFSLALNAAGVKPADVAKIDLRPKALRHAYIETQNRVVKYYDNIRFVYEIESKVREIKRATRPAEPAAEPQKESPKNNTSGQPDQREDRNYSWDENQPVLAGLTGWSDEVSSRPATSFELRAVSEHELVRGSELARSSQLAARGSPPAVARTMNRRFV